MCDVDCRIVVGMRLPATDPTAKRLLLLAIALGDKVTLRAFLRSVGALDCGRLDAALGRAPGQLLGDVRQIGGVESCIHPPRLEAHSRDVETLEGYLTTRMLSIHL